MALALVRASRLTGERAYLDQAIALGNDILDHGWVAGKGVWWNKTHTQRATASNFGPVILASRLFDHTHDAKWERMAKEVYANWLEKMVNAKTHEVADHVDPGGKPIWVNYTYNYGLAIGASLALHHISGDAGYLAHAHAFAAFLLAHRTEKTPHGDVLTDGDGCKNDCDAFKGIGFRYLATLYDQDRSHTEYRAVLDASAAAIWADAREKSSTTFGSSWTRGASGRTTLAADASAVMALNLIVGVDR
jgi:predicted alpha-1,6-mannanase (GH76 family)